MSPSARWVLAIVVLAAGVDSFQVDTAPEAGLSADFITHVAEAKLQLAKARLHTIRDEVNAMQPVQADDAEDTVLLQSPSDLSFPRERSETLLFEAEATTTTSSDATFLHQLSDDIKTEGVFHYFSSRAAFWIGIASACMIMCLLQLACCTPYTQQGEGEAFDDLAEAWVPAGKNARFVGSPVRSPYFGGSPYNAAGYVGSPSSHPMSDRSPGSP